MKQKHKEKFDFEILGVFDGFVINSIFNKSINTFLHDIMEDNHLFNKIYKKKNLADFLKLFIQNMFNNIDTYENLEEIDVFINTQDMKQFNTKVYIPKTIINEKKHEEFLVLGPDYLIGQLEPETIFNYILAPLYVNLAKNDLIDNKEFRKLASYQIGLH